MSVKIVAGKFKGISVKVPGCARPTLSRFRQSLFDMLESMESGRDSFFAGKTILDCFAGSGAFGLEVLSRGAEHAYFVDTNAEAIASLYFNIKKLKVENFSTVIHGSAEFLKKCSSRLCDIVFLDPPYGKVSISRTLDNLLFKKWIAENALIITEENAKKTEMLNDKYQEATSRVYGNSIFRIIKLNQNRN